MSLILPIALVAIAAVILGAFLPAEAAYRPPPPTDSDLEPRPSSTLQPTPTASPTGGSEPPPTITPTITPTEPPSLAPDIWAEPGAFEVSLPKGQKQQEILTIGNEGGSALAFSVTVRGRATPIVTPIPRESLEALTFPQEKVEPGLREILTASPTGRGSFLVYLKEQADLKPALALAQRDPRGEYVFKALVETAQSSQADLIRYLETRIGTRSVSDYRPFYIVNAIKVTADLETLNALAARPEVAYIESIKRYPLPEPIPAQSDQVMGVEWGIAMIGADRVWSQYNARGAGVVVANIDTGVFADHPALQAQYRGTATGSHDYNWFDPRGAAAPFDNHGHGTHTMGTMVGDDGAGNQIGVAPEAQWIAAKGCVSAYCTSDDLLASAEWVLAPYPVGGSPSQGDPSKRPHAVNNSWGGWGGNLWYQASVNAWRAAGIFPAFAAGNSGPGSGSISSPGDYAESFASGAVDQNDVVPYFSGRGPSSLTDEIKPDLTAPGVAVRSAWRNGGYYTASGTSMASPHTAGCVALILSKESDLDLTALEQILISTGVDLGAPGPDYDYGHGRLDCHAAVSQVAAPTVSWLRVEPSTGQVPPEGNVPLRLTFDASGLSLGSYRARILVESNDPDEDPLAIPVVLNVTSPRPPEIVLKPTAFDATLLPGQSTREVLMIGNLGGQTLTFELTLLTRLDEHAEEDSARPIEPGWLHVKPTEGRIAPGRAAKVSVYLDAGDLKPGLYRASIVVHSNDPDQSEIYVPVTLRVRKLKPPDIAVEPEAFQAALLPGEIARERLTITNEGGGTLGFEIEVLIRIPMQEEEVRPIQPPWLYLKPTSGELNEGQSMDIAVYLDASRLEPGLYEGTILIFSNDPDENPLKVPVRLEVGKGPPREIEPIPTEVPPSEP
jgi:hypothetical protein